MNITTSPTSLERYQTKFNFIPSAFQVDIFDAIENSLDSLIISAVAGSGKTTTIVNALKLIPKGKDTIFLAFNKSIVKELTERVPDTVSVSTLHSYGCRMIMMNYGKVKINENKVFNLGLELYERWNINEEENKYHYVGRVSKLVDFMRFNMIDDDLEKIEELADTYNINIYGKECEHAIKLLAVSNKIINEIDFADMIYFPAIKDLKMKRYDYVFVDEMQDLNRAQQEMVKKIINKTGRLIGVGDEHQCQPDGTKVLLTNGEYKNIEHIKKGDVVVSYDTNGANFVGWNCESKQSVKQGRKVENILRRKYEGELLTVFSDYGQSRYTPNHRCIVKFNKKMLGKHWLIYMMRKGDVFRIGKTHVRDNASGQFGLAARCRAEKADAAWILDFCETSDEAYFMEQLYSWQFGIPQLCFEATSNATGVFKNKENFDLFFEYLEPLLMERALKCLEFFGRKLEYPLIKKGVKQRFAVYGMFEMNPNNIMPNLMEIYHFVGKEKGEWHIVCKIEHEQYDGYVTSLKIDKYERYVSDGILTHNSIYGFAGADSESYERMKNIKPNTRELPLSVCYRLTQELVKHAQEIVPHIQWSDTAAIGIPPREGIIDDIDGKSFVLCRNTKPLVQMFIELLRQGKKANIKGREIGKSIITVVEKTKQKTVFNLLKHLQVQRIKIKSKLSAKGVMKLDEHPRIVTFDEMFSIIKILAIKFTSTDQLMKYIDTIFLDDDIPGITLSTVHKAKGLEADKVFILMPDLMPSIWAISEKQKVQEQNLIYVARTRAKKELIYIRDFEITREIKDETVAIAEEEINLNT